jgi:transposase-like protein
MAKHPKPEEIVAKLRQADVLISQGQSVSDTIRALGVSSVTYYRWRREFGGLKSDQVRRMKDLEIENQRLRKAIADLTLDKLSLQEASRGINARKLAPSSRSETRSIIILVSGVQIPPSLPSFSTC